MLQGQVGLKPRGQLAVVHWRSHPRVHTSLSDLAVQGGRSRADAAAAPEGAAPGRSGAGEHTPQRLAAAERLCEPLHWHRPPHRRHGFGLRRATAVEVDKSIFRVKFATRCGRQRDMISRRPC